MTSNKTSEWTKTIDIVMKEEMAEELERRAKSLKISTSTYCKIILRQWMNSEQKLRVEG